MTRRITVEEVLELRRKGFNGIPLSLDVYHGNYVYGFNIAMNQVRQWAMGCEVDMREFNNGFADGTAVREAVFNQGAK